MPFEYDFGKNFLETVQRTLDRRQRANLFGRDLAQRNKQQGLLNILRGREVSVAARVATVRERTATTSEAQEKRLGVQVPASPQRELLRTESKGGILSDIFGYKENGKEVILDINRRNLPSTDLPLQGKEKETKFPATIGTTIATIDNNLKDLKKFYGDSGDERTEDEVEIRTGKGTFTNLTYEEAKQQAQRDLTKGMVDAKVPIDGEVANYIRGFIEDGDSATQKRAIMSAALNEAKNKFNLTQTQITILKSWIETGTR